MAIDVIKEQGSILNGRVTVFSPNLGQHYNGVVSSTGDLYNRYKDRFKANVLFNIDQYDGVWAMSNNWISNGIVLDQRSNLGDDRDLQPKRARSFTGTEYGEIPDLSIDGATDDFTISLWMYVNAFDGTNLQYVLDFDTRNFAMVTRANSFIIYTASSVTERWSSAASAVGLGAWTHITFTWDSSEGEGKLYINNVEDTLTVVGTPAPQTFDSGTIGCLGAGSQPLDGKLFDVRIYNSLLTEEQITALYTFTNIPTDNLVFAPHCDEESGDTGFDSSLNDNHVTWVNSPAVYENRSIPYSYLNELINDECWRFNADSSYVESGIDI